MVRLGNNTRKRTFWLSSVLILYVMACTVAANSKERNYMPQPEEQENEAFKRFMDELSSDESFEPMDEEEFDSTTAVHKECGTPECIKQAEVIQRSMDTKADPCTDFYQYACGGFLKTPIPVESSHWSNFALLYERNENTLRKLIMGLEGKTENKPLKMAYDFYSACTDEKQREKRGNKPLLKLIKTLGSWPVIDDEWNPETWDLLRTIAAVNRLSIMPIFAVGLGTDPRNSSSPNRLKVGPHKPLLGDTSFYLKTKNTKNNYTRKVLRSYFKLMVRLTAKLSPKYRSIRHIFYQMRETLRFEVKLAKLLSKQEKKKVKTLRITELRELQERTPEFDWTQYFGDLFDGLGQTPTNSEMVQVTGLGYLKEVFKLVANTDERILANFIIWNVVYNFAPALTDDIHRLYMDYYRVKFGIERDTPLWRRCVRATDKTIDMAVSRLFVSHTFSGKSKEIADQTIGCIRQAFIDNLESIQWMDAKTKQAAREKAKAMFQQVGFPEFIKNDTLLNIYFAGLEINRKTHFENEINNKLVRMNNTLKSRGKVPSRFGWSMRPTEVNAYYQNIDNKIVVPAGLLQPPFFHESFPDAWRFGAIGFATGHELTHGFDNSGRKYDKHGDRVNWWSKSSKKAFFERARCLAKQYSSYTLYGEHVNGEKTLGEDIADNGGIKLAHMAYHKWLKKRGGNQTTFPGVSLPPEKLFFLGMAQLWCYKAKRASALSSLKTDVHSPSKVRVLAALSNSDEFAKAFSCPKGSRMNPKKKCRLW